MDLTNVQRDFGSDVVLAGGLFLPLAIALLWVRGSWLRRSGDARPWRSAVLETMFVGYVVAVAAVTLVPKAYVEEYQGSRIDWRLWSSDLTYAPERVQVLANLVLLAPIPVLWLLRSYPRIRLGSALALCVIVPAGIEAAQGSVVAGRVAALEDVLVGAAGAVAATMVTTLLLRRWRAARGAPSDTVVQV